jgi:hypothetical protein
MPSCQEVRARTDSVSCTVTYSRPNSRLRTQTGSAPVFVGRIYQRMCLANYLKTISINQSAQHRAAAGPTDKVPPRALASAPGQERRPSQALNGPHEEPGHDSESQTDTSESYPSHIRVLAESFLSRAFSRGRVAPPATPPRRPSGRRGTPTPPPRPRPGPAPARPPRPRRAARAT